MTGTNEGIHPSRAYAPQSEEARFTPQFSDDTPDLAANMGRAWNEAKYLGTIFPIILPLLYGCTPAGAATHPPKELTDEARGSIPTLIEPIPSPTRVDPSPKKIPTHVGVLPAVGFGPPPTESSTPVGISPSTTPEIKPSLPPAETKIVPPTPTEPEATATNQATRELYPTPEKGVQMEDYFFTKEELPAGAIVLDEKTPLKDWSKVQVPGPGKVFAKCNYLLHLVYNNLGWKIDSKTRDWKIDSKTHQRIPTGSGKYISALDVDLTQPGNKCGGLVSTEGDMKKMAGSLDPNADEETKVFFTNQDKALSLAFADRLMDLIHADKVYIDAGIRFRLSGAPVFDANGAWTGKWTPAWVAEDHPYPQADPTFYIYPNITPFPVTTPTP